MTEERYRAIDLCIKGMAAVISIAGVWYGYQKYMGEYERENRKPYVELQLRVYSELLDAVAKITHPASDAERVEYMKKFWRIHAGVADIVSDDGVNEATASASVCIHKLETKQCEKFELEAHLGNLASAMRNSLLKSWNLTGDGESLLSTRSRKE